MTTFKGYSTYSDIENPKIKAWNRCAAFYNITKDVSQAVGERYLSHFNDLDRQRIKSIISDIKIKGYMAVRREVMNEFKR